MPPLPPINKFLQLAAACEKLTMTSSPLIGAPPGSYGRRLYGYGQAEGHTVRYTDFAAGLEVPGSLSIVNGNGYACGTTNYTKWIADHDDDHKVLFRNGCIRSAIKMVEDWRAANPGDDTYKLLKGTAYGSEPSPTTCGDPPHTFNALDMWRMARPVDHEYIVQCTTPPFTIDVPIAGVVSQIGSANIDWTDTNPTIDWLAHHLWRVNTYCEINAATPIAPDVLAYVRQGATVLGAWAQVKLSTLQIHQSTMTYSATTTREGTPPVYTWDCAGNYFWETLTAGTVGFAAVGIRGDGTFDFIVGSEMDSAQITTDEWAWVDLTKTVKAIFAVWNGPYKGFALIPMDANINKALSEAGAGEGFLARMTPVISRDCEVWSDDGHAKQIAYSAAMRLYGYSALEVQNMHVAYELPSSTVSRLLDYGPRPSLVP